MVDYDGEDILETYINALNWTGATLVEPTYYKGGIHKSSEGVPNVIIFRQIGGSPPELANLSDHYYMTHLVEITYSNITKALAWANFHFIVKNIFKYNSDVTIKMQSNAITINYTESRKEITMTVTVREMKNL